MAIGFLIVNGTLNNAQYFITVDELITRPDLAGQTVRVSGAVIGETIRYDADTLTIYFDIAHVPEETDNLALTLHQAASDPDVNRLAVVVVNEPMSRCLICWSMRRRRF